MSKGEMLIQAINCARSYSGKKAVGRKAQFYPKPQHMDRKNARQSRKRALTDEQVRWARAQKGQLKQREIGEALGVSVSTIGDIHAELQYADVD